MPGVVSARPHSRSIKSATRGAVHKLVSYPSTAGPRFSSPAMRRNSAAPSRGLRPRARLSSNRLALPVPPAWPAMHRLTVRAQHPAPLLLASFPAAISWRPADGAPPAHQKSRFTPRGLPMPAKLYQTSAYVNYIARFNRLWLVSSDELRNAPLSQILGIGPSEPLSSRNGSYFLNGGPGDTVRSGFSVSGYSTTKDSVYVAPRLVP